MKYKAVLAGTYRNLIEDLYLGLDGLDCITSSVILSDVQKHLKFFSPEIIILCLCDDSAYMAHMITEIQKILTEKEIAVAVIGSQSDIDAYKENAQEPADIYLTKPLKNSIIMTSIEAFMNEREKQREELRLLEEQRLAEEKKPHILIVDDDPNMLALLKNELEKDYRIATAINGGLALRFLTKKTTDLILLDYEMPLQSGPQVLTILRNNEATKNIPVIFLTGVHDTQKIAKVLELKPQGYLLKPVDTKKLAEKVKSVLTKE